MPMYELALPPNARNVKLRKDTYEYPLDIADAGFTRAGIDGNEIILPLCGGTEHIGEILDGQWVKGWTVGMDAAQAFTAIIDGSGTLNMKGEADAAGVTGYGWINGKYPIVLIDETEIAVSLQVPIDDTGGVANRAILLLLYLTKDKIITNPDAEDDWFVIITDVNENGLIYVIYKKVNGAITKLFDGSTYDEATGRATGDIEAAIWRMTVHEGHYGEASPNDVKHMHVYLKQSDTIANAEAAEEIQLTTSPYDISDLRFKVAYPTYQIRSQNTTYYDTGNEAKSTYLRVDYPDFEILCDLDLSSPPTELSLGEVELWDGDPDTTGIRVYAPGSSLGVEHEFSGDCYLQNGLLRLRIQNLTLNGANPAWYDGAVWRYTQNRFYPQIIAPSSNVQYTELIDVIKVTPDEVIILVRFRDSAVKDDDFFVDYRISLKRGSYKWEITFPAMYPLSDFAFWVPGATRPRFGYGGDDAVADDDLGITGNNPTMTDNFMLALDDEGDLVLSFMGASKYPTNEFELNNGGWFKFEQVDVDTFKEITVYLGYSPFPLIANLFEEAEDATLAGGATAVGDGAASGGQAALLNAQNENVSYTIIAGTDLPEGRYRAIFRIRDINQINVDVQIRVTNTTDASQRNEENAFDYFTATASYAFYGVTFDITATDVNGTDNISLRVQKALADANEIYVDDFLIIPICDGESWPQDLAHAPARLNTKARRILAK